jgi:hypothetical protein
MEINGKKYLFRFKYKALKEFMQVTGLKLADLADSSTMTIYAGEMLFFGLKYGEKFAGREFDLTLDQVIDWIEADEGNLSSALGALSEDSNVGE